MAETDQRESGDGTDSESPDDFKQGSWRDSLLAGLPHLLLALLIGLTSLPAIRGQLSPGLQRLAPIFTGVTVLGMVAVLLVGLLKARREGWPLWSASWYLYAIIPILMAPIIFLQEASFARRVSLDQAYLYIALPLVLGLFFYLLIRRDRFMALMAVLPLVAILWTPVLEFVPSPLRTWLTIAAWLLAALTAAASVRLNNPGIAIWLALGMNLLIGLPYAYAQTYLKVLPEGTPAHWLTPPTTLDFVHRFAPHFLGTAALILGPALIWKLRHLGRQGDNQGLWGYRLAAIGFTLMVVGNLASFWWMTGHWPSGDYFPYQVLVYGGLGLYLFGSILLLATTTTRKRWPEAASSVLLVLVLLGLPLVLMLPLLLGMRSMPPAMPFAFLHIHDSRLIVYGLGFAWLLLAGWLAARPTQPSKRGPKLPLGMLAAALAAVLPIAAFSLHPVLHEILGWSFSATFLICYGILLAGIAVAWLKGFPRWSFPYVGLILTVTWGQMWLLNRWIWAHMEDIGLVEATYLVPKWPVWALLAGLTIAFLATEVVNATYWIGQNELWMEEAGIRFALNMVVGWAILMALLLASSLIGTVRRSIRSMETVC
ncbi:MAG: hypothetical protein U9R25_13475 [Chloroflexota bacterium]|nr:hypothetical protein [Chloroflexota bacterium]